MTHERIHVDLHSLMGPSDILSPRLPAWFDEGLAGYLSNDLRYDPMLPNDALWIKEAQNFRDWSKMTRAHGRKQTYGAAKTLVAEIDQSLGRDGLRTLIDDVAVSRDLNTALSKAIAAKNLDLTQ